MITMFGSVALGLLMPAQDAGFQHVTPPAGHGNETPPPRALPLLDRCPDGVEDRTGSNAGKRSYTQFRFGSAGTTRIAIAVDRLDGGAIRLWVDGNRDRKLDAADRIDGKGPIWRLPLELARKVDTDTDFATRPVFLRVHRNVVAFAPVGYLEGRTRFGDKTVTVRRVDADGNASYADAVDRLHIDIDGDGEFDGFREVFLYAPVLSIGDARWIVRETPGGGVTFAKLEGTGTFRLAVRKSVKTALRELTVTLQSKDGVTVALDATSKSTVAPIGDYRVVALQASFADAKGGQPWGFVFSASGKAKRRFELGKDAKLDVDPFAGLSLDVGIPKDAAEAGELLTLQPRLTTADGLLINSCWRGQHTGFGHFGPSARIVLRGPSGKQLDTANSGFA